MFVQRFSVLIVTCASPTNWIQHPGQAALKSPWPA